MYDIKQSNQVLDALGGNVAVANALDVSSQTVSYWRRTGIPRAWAMYIALRYKKQLKGVV